MSEAFKNHRAAALAAINSGAPLSVREGQFLGSTAFNPNPLTERQERWLLALLKRLGLPTYEDGGEA